MSLSISSILASISKAVQPLEQAISSQNEFKKFMLGLGWKFPGIPQPFTAYSTVLANIKVLYNALKDGKISSDELVQMASAVKQIIQNINSLQGQSSYFSSNYAAQQAEGFSGTIFKELPDYLICTWMEKELPVLYNLLVSMSLIKVTMVDINTPVRVPYFKYEIVYGDLMRIFTEPGQLFADTYQWGTNDFNHKLLLSNIYYLVSSFGVRNIYLQRYSNYKGVINSQALPGSPILNTLQFILWRYFNDPVAATFALELGPLPAVSPGQFPGLFLTPVLDGAFNVNASLGDSDWEVTASGSVHYQDGLMVLVRPGSGIEIKNNLNNIAATTTGNFYVGLIKKADSPDTPITLLGNPGGTALQCNSISLEAGFDKEASQAGDVYAELAITGGVLKIAASKDGFLSKILPKDGLEVDFDFSIGYSLKKGLYFGKNSIGFVLDVPSLSIGIDTAAFSIKLHDLHLAMKINGQEFTITGAVGISLNIAGVLAVEVQEIGVKSVVEFKRNDGSLGLANAKIAFKFPSGVAIAINASAVTGGGFLNYNEDTYTYTGGLELKFSKISLAAIGILTTKMPDGSDGFSLLIIITAEFTPIQLGMGFTLNGVGGLLGLNRTINTDRLRSGVKDSTLDSILFPTDIVKNANAIISNLGQVFPVKKDRFLIGPMAKLGWGTPTLITIELGIIIELPSPVLLAIVGVIKAILPTKESKILAIQVNFVGIIDFDKKQLSFDASLYDSSILTFALLGDMALRLYWGDKPNFLLSVGGFHPKFTPPPMNLPQMQRLSIILASSSNLNIKVETYFAITSNSVQFGARVDARAKAWKIEAVGALWFDILIQFSPFHFIANMGVMFEIRKGSSCILSIYIDLTVEGPHPWRVQGKGSFKILFVRVNVSFDKTFGQGKQETIAPAAIAQQVHDALLNKDNWQVIGPDKSHQVVAFRDITNSTGTNLVIDPFGSLQLSQKVAPMGIKLARFGTSAISDFNQFRISGVTVGSPAVALTNQPVQDYFAPNSFFYLTDDQKLSRDSYEKYTSGFALGNPDRISSDYFVHRSIEYDEIIIDQRQRKKLSLPYQLSLAEFQLHVMDSYITRSPLAASTSRTPLGGPKKLNVQEGAFQLADKNTLNAIGSLTFNSYTEAAVYMDTLRLDPNYANFMVVNSFEL